MTLYSYAESNIRKTWLYLAGFFVLLIGLGWLFSAYYKSPTILWFAVLLSTAMSVASYWFSDSIALSMSGAKPIKKEDNPELYRIVENLAITAGLPTPAVFIINDAQPNAFATGRDPKHAVVAVTTGLLERLERAELEGVIAHEFAHIGNRDVLLATVIVVLVGIVALLSDFFFRITWYGGRGRSRDDNRGQLGVLLLVVSIVAAIVAPLAANLIKLAISRKREFLADASGALLTRYPEGLAKALEKISAFSGQLRAANHATAHLYIASPFRGKESVGWFQKLFTTHPPIAERIAALRGMKI